MRTKEETVEIDRRHLEDIASGVRSELLAPQQRRTSPIHAPPAGFARNARVYIDGDTIAFVLDFYPNGSTSYGFPHYRIDVEDGDRNIAVHVSRVGVIPACAPDLSSENRPRPP